MRWIASIVLGLTATTLAGEARAQREPDARACVTAHVDVQEKRLAGDLAGALQVAAICKAAPCPALPRGDCERWAAELEGEAPRITVTIVAPPPGPVRLTIDGAAATEGADVRVNPGDHSVVVEASGRVERRSVHLLKGGHETVRVDFTGPRLSTPNPAKGGPRTAAAIPIGPIVVGSVGVVAAIVFGVAGGLGFSQYEDLRATCGHACTAADKDAVDTKFLVADIGLGVGAAALGGALVWLAIDLALPGRHATDGRGLVVAF